MCLKSTSKPQGKQNKEKGEKWSMFVSSDTWLDPFPFWSPTHISAYVESIFKKYTTKTY